MRSVPRSRGRRVRVPVSDDVKSVCDEITARGLSAAAWRERRPTFRRATCVCVLTPLGRAGVAFRFSVIGDDDWVQAARPLRLPGVADISAGRVDTIALRPAGGSRPDTDGLRRVESDPFAIECAISDAINVFVREGLVARGLLPDDWDSDRSLLAFKYQIAAHWARRWRVCWVNDAAGGWRPGTTITPVAPHP